MLSSPGAGQKNIYTGGSIPASTKKNILLAVNRPKKHKKE